MILGNEGIVSTDELLSNFPLKGLDLGKLQDRMEAWVTHLKQFLPGPGQ